jgi:hypothetical protein
VWHSRTPDGVRCAHFPSVITHKMDRKVQLLLLKPLNLGELNTAYQNRKIFNQCFFLTFFKVSFLLLAFETVSSNCGMFVAFLMKTTIN